MLIATPAGPSTSARHSRQIGIGTARVESQHAPRQPSYTSSDCRDASHHRWPNEMSSDDCQRSDTAAYAQSRIAVMISPGASSWM
jgi:hypothetical protein